MGKETERSAEMRRVLEEYAASGLTRREFCERRGIALTTFDYWRREHAMDSSAKITSGFPTIQEPTGSGVMAAPLASADLALQLLRPAQHHVQLGDWLVRRTL